MSLSAMARDVVTLAQGQDTTRDESSGTPENGKKSKNKKRQAGATPAAGGGALNSPYAIGVGWRRSDWC